MGKKVTIYLLGFVSLCCFVLGIIGILQSKANGTIEGDPNYKIKYNYYVDDEEVENKPINTNATKPEYVFNRFSCTNKVTGNWDNANWNFNPELTNNATCKLYFNKAYYKLEFEIEYGELRNKDNSVMSETDKAKDITVEREKNLTAKIMPDEGYSLVSVECDKKNITDWDKENNELTVKSIKSDTKCVVKFAISSYEVDLKVSNGTGATTLNSEHGKSVNASIAPTTGYGNPTVTCTNNQKGIWNDNKFTIEKIENSTSCTIEFKLLTYEIEVSVIGGTSTPSKNSVNYNGSKEFTITANAGYIINEGYGLTGCTNGLLKYTDDTLLLTVSDVTQNTKCDVTLAQAQVSSSTTED